MNHNAIFINNYGAGVASVVKLDEQAYNQFTSSQDTEFAKFKKAYAEGKLGIMPTSGYSADPTLGDILDAGNANDVYPFSDDLDFDEERRQVEELQRRQAVNAESLDTVIDAGGKNDTLKFSDDDLDFDEERRQVEEFNRRAAGWYSLSDIVDEGTDEDVSKLDYSDLDVDEERRQVAELQRRNAGYSLSDIVDEDAVSDPEGLYSFAAENRTTDAGLEKVAIDLTFIENLFLSTKNASQHTDRYNIESYIVHDSAGRTDYVLMYNKSTGKAGIAPLGVFYGLRLRVTELDDQRFREMVKKYSGAVEAEHRALLSIADGGCTPYKDDQDESIGGISTTIGNKLVDRRMLVSLRSTKNTGTMLYAGDYHGYFNIDRESFINNGYYEYIKNTPYMYTPDDFGDTVELFKDAFYMFTDDEIDWNVLTELLKKLPEDVRIQVPGPFSTGGSFWEVKTVGLVNGRLEVMRG